MDYKINSTKRYKVTFLKDFASYKAGNEAMVSMPIAIKFVNAGLVKADKELFADAKANGADELIKRQKTVE